MHPEYKTKYQVGNWPDYDKSLVQHGDITLWISPGAIKRWRPTPSGRRGGQQKYSDLAIETTLTLRLIFHLSLRQAEGFVRSIFAIMSTSTLLTTPLSRAEVDSSSCRACRRARRDRSIS